MNTTTIASIQEAMKMWNQLTEIAKKTWPNDSPEQTFQKVSSKMNELLSIA